MEVSFRVSATGYGSQIVSPTKHSIAAAKVLSPPQSNHISNSSIELIPGSTWMSPMNNPNNRPPPVRELCESAKRLKDYARSIRVKSNGTCQEELAIDVLKEHG